MKRTPEEREYSELDKKIKRYHSTFKWQTCFICDHDFRREYGWVLDIPTWLDNPYGTGSSGLYWSIKYICIDCLPTRQKAIEYLKNRISLEKL